VIIGVQQMLSVEWPVDKTVYLSSFRIAFLMCCDMWICSVVAAISRSAVHEGQYLRRKTCRIVIGLRKHGSIVGRILLMKDRLTHLLSGSLAESVRCFEQAS
jgi:hypothetical protein